MFIYFPEFFYRRTKTYIENTFSKPFDKKAISTSLELLLSEAMEETKKKKAKSILYILITMIKNDYKFT